MENSARDAAICRRFRIWTDPSTDTARKDEAALARQRVRDLRSEAFSYGGLSLTREVLRRFVESPEVRALLPADRSDSSEV